MRPDRRVMLRWVLAGGLAAIGAGTAYPFLRSKGPLGDADATEAAARMGAAFMGQFPQEGSVEALTRQLFGADARGLASLQPESIRERILAAADSDFRSGKVLHFDGWIVSLAEGRVGALVYLLGTG
jgi:hypothetical protein